MRLVTRDDIEHLKRAIGTGIHAVNNAHLLPQDGALRAAAAADLREGYALAEDILQDPERPEYVKCIRRPFAAATDSWCGRPLPEQVWAFTGLDHAAANAVNGGRLLACSECVSGVFAVLRPGEASA